MVEKNTALPVVKTGILGGTGLYQIEGLEIIDEVALDTPFGKPSDPYIIGNLEGHTVAFLSRHGRGHGILPSEVNFRANICGFKMLGVEQILAVNSVGSLKEEIEPRDIVVPDQFFDRTRRKNTFFSDGIAAHLGFSEPVCSGLAQALGRAGQESGIAIHSGGTYICIEGPMFSTKAESHIYRSWGCDIIGMTSVTEARLSREAEICYATMCLVTDYDVWHESEGPVTVDMILENMAKNIDSAKAILKRTLQLLAEDPAEDCICRHALEYAIVTQPDLIPPETKKRLRFIIGKYIS